MQVLHLKGDLHLYSRCGLSWPIGLRWLRQLRSQGLRPDRVAVQAASVAMGVERWHLALRELKSMGSWVKLKAKRC